MSEEQSSLFQRDYSFVIGNEDAKVQLVEFFDPACETCALFHPHVKEIMKKMRGKSNWFLDMHLIIKIQIML